MAASKVDETFFLRQGFLNRIEQVRNADKALVKSIVEIYMDKIVSTANKEETVSWNKLPAKLPGRKHPAPACFAGPFCCDEAAAFIYFDEPASCKEAHSEGVPCGKAPCEETPKAVYY